MRSNLAGRAHRVEVTDPIVLTQPHDYADSFAIEAVPADPTPPGEWLRTGLSGTPRVVKWLFSTMRTGRSTVSTPSMAERGERWDVWRVRAETPDVLHLALTLAPLRITLVGRRIGPTRRTLTTGVDYRGPLLGRLIMTVIGPAHRWTARRVLSAGLGTRPPATIRRSVT